jgi:hypothetical protein
MVNRFALAIGSPKTSAGLNYSLRRQNMWHYGMATLVSIVVMGPAEAQSWLPWANETSYSPPARSQDTPLGATGFFFLTARV